MPLPPRAGARAGARTAALVCVTLAALVGTAVTVGAAASPRAPIARAALPSTAPTVPTAPSAANGWHVTALGHGRYDVSWTSPTRLPLTSDRPTITGDALSFGVSTVRPDGRTVHAVVTAATPPDPARLDALLSGDRLDEPGHDQPARQGTGSTRGPAAAAAVPPTHLLAAPDPGVAGPYATVTSDYTLPSVKVPGLPKAIEMLGHVVEPDPTAATGPRPLVLFLHGRHDVCYQPGHPDAYTSTWPCRSPFQEIPSDLGYTYLQDLLASQGYTTVSVRVNGINAQDDRLADGGAGARALVVRRHLDHWTTIAAAHQVDLSRVVLVGHSRGGEGVDRAALQVPLTAPYSIVGQVLIAPVDFASHTAPYVPTVTLLPYCDGDVFDLQGQRYTDTGRDVAPGDPSLKSSVLIMGADHNFFNTEWTPGIAQAPAFDDWGGPPHAPCGSKTPGRLDPTGQRSVAKAYVAGAVALFTGDDAYLPLFDGSHVTVPSIGAADVRSAAIGGGRSLRRPGVDASPTLATGGARTSLCTGVVSFDPDAYGDCGRRLGDVITPHWAGDGEGIPTRTFLEMSWHRAGATGGLHLDAPLDLSTDRLELRTIVDPSRGDVRLRVRIGDGAGHSAVLTPQDGETLPALLDAPGVTKLWAQALLVDATGATGVDLTDITSVELVGDSAQGRIWVADLSSAPATLPSVPATRLPLIELGDLTLHEGNGRAHHMARVPFHLDGPVTSPGRFRVVTTGQGIGDVHRFTVDVAPGQTSGTIPVGYLSNNIDDNDAQTQVAAWPLRGVATDAYLSTFTLLDDDPTPATTVRTVGRAVREGARATFRIALARRVGYDVYVYGQVVRGTGDPVRGTDVPLAWLRTHAVGTDVGHYLYRLKVYVSANLKAGSRRVDVTVPIARDGLREGHETLTVTLHVGRERFTRQVVVLPSR